MAKRFTDTDIWEKKWFRKLSPKHKCLFRYLYERCDHAGVIEFDEEVASLFIGEEITSKDLEALKDHYTIIKGDKIFLTDFINFQYGKLSVNSKPNKAVINKLEKHGIDYKGYLKGMDTLKDKVKEKGKVKETEKEKEKVDLEYIRNILSDYPCPIETDDALEILVAELDPSNIEDFKTAVSSAVKYYKGQEHIKKASNFAKCWRDYINITRPELVLVDSSRITQILSQNKSIDEIEDLTDLERTFLEKNGGISSLSRRETKDITKLVYSFNLSA